ncbi:hypothetical protein W97_02147 [Coniosporium apollinis CBS 100218]|uniref:Large ribosomal subunit protein uL3m n=1 Tax=Coniosporium apollinis (strain CBS 100218) TaxID=1168221 RepID=R7YMN4_CONA1|nr:uncharacterized protein W97_02147 [Coniosporium apollinis CBS 100218]EON62921.1 hypothetical protein W97_02147 [Coniosporium apollinis CBS 100218]
MPPRIPVPRAPSPLHQLLPITAKRTIKSLLRPQTTRFNYSPNLPTLTSTPTGALARKEASDTLPHRTGALAIKRGMTALYDATSGRRTPCTVLQLDRVQVLAHKRRDRHGYWAVQVGAGSRQPKNVTRPMAGHFKAAGVSPKRWVAEFRVRDEGGLLKLGETISPRWFQEGQFVDARADCKGKGFAGGMKKHGWAGQPASHGQSLTHRTMGSAGGSQGSGSRVHPGKNMAGRMGGQRVTVQNLKVLKVDETNGIVVVNGSVSGPKGCVVRIQDALKKAWPEIPSPIAEASATTTA